MSSYVLENVLQMTAPLTILTLLQVFHYDHLKCENMLTRQQVASWKPSGIMTSKLINTVTMYGYVMFQHALVQSLYNNIHFIHKSLIKQAGRLIPILTKLSLPHERQMYFKP